MLSQIDDLLGTLPSEEKESLKGKYLISLSHLVSSNGHSAKLVTVPGCFLVNTTELYFMRLYVTIAQTHE